MKSEATSLLLALTCCLALQLAAARPQGSGSLVSVASSQGVTRLRSSQIRRPESCREALPRRSEELPALVVTGRVKEVYLSGEELRVTNTTNITTTTIVDGRASTQTQSFSSANTLSSVGANPRENKALVGVIRVIKGDRQLEGADIIVSNFNSSDSQPCPNFVKPNDTLILLLDQEAERSYSVHGANLLGMNLANLDRVNAIAADEPPKRRGPIGDIQCEGHYCPFGRCVSPERGPPTCQCPDSCPPLPAPVCGSDNSTYPSECHLVREGCQRRRPLFVTKESSC